MIFFNVPAARDHLIKNGFVYTLRRHRLHLGLDHAVYGKFFHQNEIGKCNIEFIKSITVSALIREGIQQTKRRYQYFDENIEIGLKDYVEHSGFASVKEWVASAKKFLYQETVWYLYKVSLVN